MTTAIAMQYDLFTEEPCRGARAVTVIVDGASKAGSTIRAPRSVHAHSLAAHDEHAAEHIGRKRLIMDCIHLAGVPLTDRQILERIYPNSDDMNRVRPRISELLKEGRLVEGVEVVDAVTKEPVRTVWLA